MKGLEGALGSLRSGWVGPWLQSVCLGAGGQQGLRVTQQVAGGPGQK